MLSGSRYTRSTAAVRSPSAYASAWVCTTTASQASPGPTGENVSAHGSLAPGGSTNARSVVDGAEAPSGSTMSAGSQVTVQPGFTAAPDISTFEIPSGSSPVLATATI